jgi:hypothetical protein
MLNHKVIDRLFARLLLRYGAQWMRMWEGIDMDAVKAEWADELSVYATNLDAIAYGLDHLPPDFPPNIAQFKAICNRRPDAPTLALPSPPINHQMADSALKAYKVTGKPTPSEWMAQLDRDGQAGTASLARKRHHAIAAANGYYGGGASSAGGDFTPINSEALPEGMRAAQ